MADAVDYICFVGWNRPPTAATFYASGLIHLRGSWSARKPGWYQVDDLAALQALFDRAKEAVRSRPGRGSKADVTVAVRMTYDSYEFRHDILRLDVATLPACHPHVFEKDGHGEDWNAMEGVPAIDNKVRR